MLAVEKMQPAVSTMSYANDFVTSHASSIKNMSWNKMNEILSTQYGIAAVHGLDLTACLVEIIIDKYFPPIGEEKFSGILVFFELLLKGLLGYYETLKKSGECEEFVSNRFFSSIVILIVI